MDELLPTIALVSRTDVEQRQRLVDLVGDGWQIIDCHQDRDLLTRAGPAVRVVYGMVRPAEFAALPRLAFVQASWAGIENLLYPPLRASDVLLANVRGAHATLMSEHAIAGILYWTRALDRHAVSRNWKADRRSWSLSRLAGSGVCLLGAGRIGQSLIPRLRALGCAVQAVNRSGRAVPGADRTVAIDAIDEVLPHCRHLVVLAPGTDATRGLVDRRLLDRLAGGGVLVNVSRGSIVVEADLLAALDAGRLAGATLDVTDPEPPPAGSPLWDHPRVLLTGHCAALGAEAEVAPFAVFVHNLRHWLAGDRAAMIDLVDKQAGY